MPTDTPNASNQARLEGNIVLCSDLDRTLIPNGTLPESPRARELLRRLRSRPEITLIYVSGRDQGLIQQAIREYALPQPDLAIGDVGVSIMDLRATTPQPYPGWTATIAADWKGIPTHEIAHLLRPFSRLELQEPERQQPYKLSYYTDAQRSAVPLVSVQQLLQREGVNANLIWSLDEQEGCGLLDILPARADKRRAIEFVLAQEPFDHASTVFAGDSGNDLDVLVSDLRAILVANADPQVKADAHRLVAASDYPQRLYQATGCLPGLNGNYAAGVIEGLVHYFPHTRAWLDL